MHTGTHQTSYIRSVKGRRAGKGGRGGDGETDSVRHKHIETETKLMDGWGKTGVSEELNELCICTPALIHRTIHALACVRVPYAGADVKMNTARSAPMQHSTVRRRSSHSPTCVWVSARGFSIIQPRELAWGGETRVGNGIPRAVVSIRKRLIGCQMCDFPREGWRFKNLSRDGGESANVCVSHVPAGIRRRNVFELKTSGASVHLTGEV